MSILISRDGLYFCITEGNSILRFVENRFSRPRTPEDLLKEVQASLNYSFDKDMIEDLSDINVIYAHSLFSLVPAEFFDENRLSDYVKFNAKLFPTDELTYDTLKNQDAKLVYIPYTNINNFLFGKFGVFHFHHSISVFVDQCLTLPYDEQTRINLNAYPSHFELCVHENGQLILANSYDYFAPEDLVYYLLFTFEQLQLNPDETDLYLSGQIDENSDVYKLVYRYIRNVYFAETTKKLVSEDSAFTDIAEHKHLLLLNSV